jgi:fermentation-respiration switch protein FrsA (DUF1100 family)
MTVLSLTTLVKIFFYALLAITLISALQFLLAIRPFSLHSNIGPSYFKLLHEEVIFVTDDGLKLKGWFIPGRDTRATVIVTHGYPADKGDLLPLAIFLHPHYNLFLFDFRYFGESEGAVTTVGHREQEDVRAALRYLKQRGEKRIGGLGFSLGAAVLLMIQDPDLKAVVADSSFADIDRMLEVVYGFLPGPTKAPFIWTTRLYSRLFLGIDPRDISPLRAIRERTQPVLIIHGARDGQIPVKHAHLLYEAAPRGIAELWIVPDADHGQTYARMPIVYQEKVLSFFSRYLQ